MQCECGEEMRQGAIGLGGDGSGGWVASQNWDCACGRFRVETVSVTCESHGVEIDLSTAVAMPKEVER